MWCFVVTSAIGAGIFLLPREVSIHAGLLANIIGWIISTLGMLTVALLLSNLSRQKPHLNNGMYIYAREGFGDSFGYISGIGYFLAILISNLYLFEVLGKALQSYFGASEFMAFMFQTTLLFTYYSIMSRGVTITSTTNSILLVIKLLPIAAFIVVGMNHADMENVDLNFYAEESGDLLSQVKSVMGITTWVYLGIEAGSVLSKKSKDRNAIGKAIVLGLFACFVAYISIVFISFSYAPRAELLNIKVPPVIYMFDSISPLMITGIFISIMACIFSWLLLSAETLHNIRKGDTDGIPRLDLAFSCISIEALLAIVYFNREIENTLVNASTICFIVPCFISAIYSMKIKKNHIISLLATIYSIWLIYSIGVEYMYIYLYIAVGYFVIKAIVDFIKKDKNLDDEKA